MAETVSKHSVNNRTEMAWDPYLWQALILLAVIFYILIQGIDAYCPPHMGVWFWILNLCNPLLSWLCCYHTLRTLFYRIILRPVLGSVTIQKVAERRSDF